MAEKRRRRLRRRRTSVNGRRTGMMVKCNLGIVLHYLFIRMATPLVFFAMHTNICISNGNPPHTFIFAPNWKYTTQHMAYIYHIAGSRCVTRRERPVIIHVPFTSIMHLYIYTQRRVDIINQVEYGIHDRLHIYIYPVCRIFYSPGNYSSWKGLTTYSVS